MKNPRRPFVTFKLNHPIVYETTDGEREVTEFKLYKPLAGQIKKVDVSRLSNEDVIDLGALCSDMTVEMLDLMEWEDLSRLDKEIANFFSRGPKDSAPTS